MLKERMGLCNVLSKFCQMPATGLYLENKNGKFVRKTCVYYITNVKKYLIVTIFSLNSIESGIF